MPDTKDAKRKIATIARNHNVRLFLMCLLVTMVLWMILTLSVSRSKRYTCPVKYVGYGQREYVLLADSTLTFDIECSGFEHLHTLFWKRSPEINIDLRNHKGKSLCVKDLNSAHVVDTQLSGLKENGLFELPLRPDWKRFTDIYPSRESVKVLVNVERQTELRFNVPLDFLCEDTSVHAKLYPSSVVVTSRVAMRDYKSISSESFKAAVRYNVDEKKDTLAVFISEFPQYVHISKVEPKNVRYLIIK